MTKSGQHTGKPSEPDAMRLQTWHEVVPTLAALDGLRDRGVTFVVKADGGRTEDYYTVVLERSGPDGLLFHKDGTDLPALLAQALASLGQSPGSAPSGD